MRDSWTESDVLGLASEEPDKFDRKSGDLLAGDKNEFYDAMAKAASAFANSGGGTLLLGVEDDGTLTGVDPLVGRTSMKDWIEQKVPNLLAYPLTLFRVHTVLPSTPSNIPIDKVVIVIEFGDSPAAPHQSMRDKKYYYRAGGRSEPAQHFYLELLRQRLTNPTLKSELESILPVHVEIVSERIYLEVKLRFWVRNIGNVAAYKWALSVRHIHNDNLSQEEHMKAAVFPFFGEFPIQRVRRSGIRVDDTILPGCSLSQEIDAGFMLSRRGSSHDEIEDSVYKIIGASIFGMQLATEMSPGIVETVRLDEKRELSEVTEFVCKAEL